jgi:DNA-directed RNA polymerase specialized sigma24 family protein
MSASRQAIDAYRAAKQRFRKVLDGVDITEPLEDTPEQEDAWAQLQAAEKALPWWYRRR